MKNLSLITLLFFGVLSAQDFNVDYAVSCGGQSFEVSNAFIKDTAGNVYTCGTFEDDITFNGSSSSITFNSAGNGDSYFAKFNDAGEVLWAHQLGNDNNCEATSIATDLSGNVYVIGRFLGTVDFDPGPEVDELFGGSDFYLTKYDTDGNYQWVRKFNSTSSEALAIETDMAGDIFLSGVFKGTVSYIPVNGGPMINFQSSLSGTAENVFVAKYNTNGEIYYVRGLDTFNTNLIGSGPSAIDIDGNGNVYVTGFFGYEVDFDPGPEQYILEGTGNTADIFVLKLTNAGAFIWARSMGGDGQDIPRDIAVDVNQNVIIGGDFRETGDFDPGAGVFELTSNGNIDAFIVKLNVSGDFEWATSFGGNNGDRVASLDTDPLGDVYSFGNFVGTVNFDTDLGGNLEITSNGQSDIFLHKLTSDGDFIYVKVFGGSSFDAGSSIKVDEEFNVYLSGAFRETVDFDPESGVLELTSINSRDVFLLKLDATIPLSIQDDDLNSITVYPNPAEDVLRISANSNLELGTYSLYTSAGKKIVSNQPFVNNLIIKHLASGMYFLKLESDQASSRVIKFIKK